MKRADFPVKAFVLGREGIEFIVQGRAVEVGVVTDGGVESEPFPAGAQVDFLVGIVKVAGIGVNGAADSKVEISDTEAVTAVVIDFNAVVYVCSPGSEIEAAGFQVQSTKG